MTVPPRRIARRTGAALRLWYREQLRQAMRAQYLAPQSEEELAEAAAWAEIRDVAGVDFVQRYDENDGV